MPPVKKAGVWKAWAKAAPMATRIAMKVLALNQTDKIYELGDLVSVSKIVFFRVFENWNPQRGPLENYFHMTLRLHLRKLVFCEFARRQRDTPLDPDSLGVLPVEINERSSGLKSLLDEAPELHPLERLLIEREFDGPPLTLRLRAISFGVAFGRGVSKSALQRARATAIDILARRLRRGKREPWQTELKPL